MTCALTCTISAVLWLSCHCGSSGSIPVQFMWDLFWTKWQWAGFSPSTSGFPSSFHHYSCCGPGSVVGIATDYGLDGPGIESWLGKRFSAPVQTGPGAHPASCTMGTGSFPGVKSGQGVTLTPLTPFSAVGHERVELYLYSPYGPYGLYRASVPVQGWPLPFIWRLIYILILSPRIILRMRIFLVGTLYRKSEHILCSKTFFFLLSKIVQFVE